jgi:hypothetical protein
MAIIMADIIDLCMAMEAPRPSMLLLLLLHAAAAAAAAAPAPVEAPRPIPRATLASSLASSFAPSAPALGTPKAPCAAARVPGALPRAVGRPSLPGPSVRRVRVHTGQGAHPDIRTY